MDTHAKVEVLGEASTYDICTASSASPTLRPGQDLQHSITSVAMPGGRGKKVLKVLLSNICENDCAYCAMRAERDLHRVAFRPEELANCFDQMWRAGLVEGLFLSSGVCNNAVREMDRMIATVEIIRRRYEFAGYVHLKLLPGVTTDQIERAAQLGDRISINLEAPNEGRLALLSARKGFQTDLMSVLQTASRLVQERDGRTRASSVTTQFVVGAAGESDREILHTSTQLYGALGLARAYYSAFSPIPDTPLAHQAPVSPQRQHRLYQSDFLVRQYGFSFDDLFFGERGDLPLQHDPKVAWARMHPELFPIEVNRAGRGDLLRIPGIGPIVADRIIRERRRARITEVCHLRKMGARVGSATEYVLLNGRRPDYQLTLWGAE